MMSFDEFWECFDEAFNNPIQIKWIDKPYEYIGLFTLNNKVYNIYTINKGDNIWTFKFYVYLDGKLSPNLTNDYKNMFRVLPTIKQGFIDLINEKNPDGIIFGALDESEGRKKLYNSFSIDISKQFDYEYTSKEKDNKKIYILYKPNINKEILFNKIIQITTDEI